MYWTNADLTRWNQCEKLHWKHSASSRRLDLQSKRVTLAVSRRMTDVYDLTGEPSRSRRRTLWEMSQQIMRKKSICRSSKLRMELLLTLCQSHRRSLVMSRRILWKYQLRRSKRRLPVRRPVRNLARRYRLLLRNASKLRKQRKQRHRRKITSQSQKLRAYSIVKPILRSSTRRRPKMKRSRFYCLTRMYISISRKTHKKVLSRSQALRR